MLNSGACVAFLELDLLVIMKMGSLVSMKIVFHTRAKKKKIIVLDPTAGQ